MPESRSIPVGSYLMIADLIAVSLVGTRLGKEVTQKPALIQIPSWDLLTKFI